MTGNAPHFRSRAAETRYEAEREADDRLFMLGLAASAFGQIVFGVLRLFTEFFTGSLTGYWVNLAATVAVFVITRYYLQDRAKRRELAVHLGVMVNTVSLVVPICYGMESSLWWLTLMPLGVALILGTRQGIIWTAIIVVVISVAHVVEPYIQIEGGAGENLLESTASRALLVALLFGVTWHARRVSDDLTRELKQANAAKDVFLANVSHEMRTPLNGVIGMSKLALQEETRPTVRRYVETAHDCAANMLGIINDLLDVAQIEAGQLRVQRAPFSLSKVLAAAMRPVTAKAQARGVVVASWVDPSVGDARIGDGQRVGQIITNLVGNAVKFTHSGSVTIALSGEGDEVRIAVTDTGPGIAEENWERLFAPFQQADSSITRKYGGTGLGLPISRDLARMMGGDIVVSSRVGRGSTFLVTLSLTSALGPTVASVPESVGGVAVRINESQVTRTAARALEAAGLLDGDVPTTARVVIDGTSSRWARQQLDSLADDQLAILLMPAGAVGDVPAHPKVGWILDQPVFSTQLIEAAGAPRPIRTVRPEPEPAAAGRILVVEDDPVSLVIIKRILQKRGYTVEQATDGIEALGVIKKHTLDCVLTDIQMPRMDGLTLLRRIRELDYDLPVVALTAHVAEADVAHFLSSGMDACLEKPVDPERVFEALEAVLRGHPQAARRAG